MEISEQELADLRKEAAKAAVLPALEAQIAAMRQDKVNSVANTIIRTNLAPLVEAAKWNPEAVDLTANFFLFRLPMKEDNSLDETKLTESVKRYVELCMPEKVQSQENGGGKVKMEGKPAGDVNKSLPTEKEYLDIYLKSGMSKDKAEHAAREAVK